MQSNRLKCKGLAPFEFFINHSSLTMASALNQHDSHIHPECEIYLNLSGDVSFMVEDKIYPVSRGSVIVTRPYEYHHCIYHSKALHDHYWILFSSEGNEHLLKSFFQRERGEGNLIILEEQALEKVLELCDRFIEKKATELGRQIDFLQLIELLDAGEHSTLQEDTLKLPGDVLFAMDYMEEHLAEPIRMEELAKLAHVSINTLERHFRESLQDTPTAILRRKRLIRASELLRKGKSVLEACEISGFSDYSNFIALFRKQFEITPLQYQKLFR